MGEQNITTDVEGQQLREFMRSVLDDLHAMERLLDEGMIEEGVRRIGGEQELFLVEESGRPALAAMEVLKNLDDPHFVTELGLFNLEINLDPQLFGGDCLRQMERQLVERLEKLRGVCYDQGLSIALIGILPTLRKSDLALDSITPLPRYYALNRALSRLRGGAYEFHIKGIDELIVKHDSVMLEACNASFQVHFQVGADEFADLYNISQLVVAPVLAAATNSPLLFGRRLWRETRIALFQQAVDTRSSSHHLRELSPRVTFGSCWVKDSVLELFRQDITRFRVLLSTELDEDPFEKLAAGEPPELQALRLHNGTVYRWNRACYGITDGKPHLRVENRVLPSGPTPLDEVANAAFWFGLISQFDRTIGDITPHMAFEDAKMNFHAAARHGLQAQFTWLEGESRPAPDLILDELLPMAEAGLQRGNIDEDDIARYLGVIERRVATGQTGSQWILSSLAAMEGQGTPEERMNAITAAAVARQKTELAVADWEKAELDEAGEWKHSFQTVEQFMTTDMFTVHEDEAVDLVANLMEWETIRHVPVEDNEHRLVGLVSYRSLLRLVGRGALGDGQPPLAVRDIMKRELITATPETSALEAIDLMRSNRIGALPVVNEGRLVGIVTERDFLDVSAGLLEQKLRE